MTDLTIEDQKILEKILLKLISYLNINAIYDCVNLNYIDLKINKLIKRTSSINQKTIDSIIIYDYHTKLDDTIANNNILIKLFDESGCYLNYPTSNVKISFHGKYFDFNKINIVNFKVLAIIHAYNEEDIIKQTILHLLNEGIDVYIIDNWSKDKTPIIINELKQAYPGRIFSEKFPQNYDNSCYDWFHQLERTEELSKELDYDWFIHYDVDEYRITPYKNMTLKEMIYIVDNLGFNIIENTLVYFRLTNKDQDNIFMKDTYFEFGKSSGCFCQQKTWKKSKTIDLKSSGGHIASIPNPRIFPLKILNRHYPFRSLEQATKKVFIDRKQRFIEEEKSIGWHTQYDLIGCENDLIISDVSQLIMWDDDTIEKYYIKLFIDSRF